MSEMIENANLREFSTLIAPAVVKERMPLPAEVATLVLHTRHAIRDVLCGDDDHRLVLIIGPCSIHDPDAAYDYAARLRKVSQRTSDALVVVMRTYFEKPRTTVGWKGLINDPRLDGSCDIETGLLLAREILIEINKAGMPCASELLDPITPQFTADLISWASIGARTTESQTHREMASGLSMPVGFKNGTDGSLDVACNALISAGHSHSFLGIGANGMMSVVSTMGNPDRHIVLRGGKEPNYGPENVQRAVEMVHAAESRLRRSVMVDTSHGNSSKDYTRQGSVAREVLRQYVAGQNEIMGMLIESNIAPGKQKWSGTETLSYGMSITDACIGWEETESLIEEIAAGVREVSSVRT